MGSLGIKNIRFLKNHRESDEIYFKKGDTVKLDRKGANDLIKRGIAKEINKNPRARIEKAQEKEAKWRIQQEKRENEETKKQLKKEKEEEKQTKKHEYLKETTINQNDVFMEPVLNSGNPKWLMITKQKIIPSDDPRPIKQRLQNPIDPEIKIDIQRMEPNMWECKKCGAQLQHEGQPLNCPNCNKQGPFEQLTKHINPDKWKLPYWEDIPQENIDMILVYDEIKKLIKNCIVFPEEIQYDLFTLWIIASYKKECFNTAPFLIFRGLISSGKTRALDLLRELGYRMVHSTGVTFPAMCRLTHFHGAGVLVDEIDNKINRKYEAGVKFLDFLKPSYRRGSTYTVADKDDQEETYTYKNFGFKAFAGETGGYDQAVFSRSIDFKMEEDYPSIPEINYVQEDLNHYQTILLNYRYKFNDPEPLPIDFPLKGRNREIFSPLIRTAHHIGIDHEHIIKYVQERKQEQIDELQDTDEYSLLKGIYELQHGLTNDGHMDLESMDAREYVSYKDLIEQIGWEGSNQKLGYLIKKKLQLKTKRIGKVGTCLILNDRKNEEKLKKYYRRYHVN